MNRKKRISGRQARGKMIEKSRCLSILEKSIPFLCKEKGNNWVCNGQEQRNGAMIFSLLKRTSPSSAGNFRAVTTNLICNQFVRNASIALLGHFQARGRQDVMAWPVLDKRHTPPMCWRKQEAMQCSVTRKLNPGTCPQSLLATAGQEYKQATQ